MGDCGGSGRSAHWLRDHARERRGQPRCTTVTEPAQPDSGHSPTGRSCPVLPGLSAITLTDTVPVPVVTVPPGARIVVR